MTRTPDTFTAAAWNVYNDTPAEEARPVLHELYRRGVSLVLGVEFSDVDNRCLFADEGWRYFYHPHQYVIAWRPEVWTPIVFDGVQLARTGYFTTQGHPMRVEAALGILCDRAGRTLTAMSYHTPSHVQVANPPARRLEATREAAATWRRLARAAETRGVLFGGDDNVDESRAGAFGAFLGDKATDLRQVQSPDPDSRGGRRILDFRVRGLKPLDGDTIPGAGDHRVHLRAFAWEATR